MLGFSVFNFIFLSHIIIPPNSIVDTTRERLVDIEEEKLKLMKESVEIKRRKLNLLEDYITWKKQQATYTCTSPSLSPVIKFWGAQLSSPNKVWNYFVFIIRPSLEEMYYGTAIPAHQPVCPSIGGFLFLISLLCSFFEDHCGTFCNLNIHFVCSCRSCAPLGENCCYM